MAQPFERREGLRGGLVGLVDRRGRARALRDIEELLADATRLRDVAESQVRDLVARQNLELGERLRTPCLRLYRRFLEHCIDDQVLSDDELEELAHLRRILGLPRDDIARVQEEVARAVYGQAIDGVLADHHIDAEERTFLERLRAELGLSSEEAERLQHEGAERARHRYISRNISHSGSVLASGETSIVLLGSSDASIEDAVIQALDETLRAAPDLRRAEVQQIDARIEDGRVKGWDVKVKLPLRRDS